MTETNDARLRLLDEREIRARRRPRALLFVWGWELVCGLLVATPVHAWAKATFDAHPDGDANIFRPGGHALMSWLGEDSTTIAVVARTTLITLFVVGVLGQLVTGALVAALATGKGERGTAPTTAFALRAGAASFFPLLGVGVVATATFGFLLGAGLFASFAVGRSLEDSAGDARAFVTGAAVLAAFIVLALLAGVAADLVRVALARNAAAMALDAPRETTASMARRIRRALPSAVLGWGWRAALSLALLYAGARAGDVAGARDGLALWLLFAFHQLVVFARAGLRASWLANALRLVSRPEREPVPSMDPPAATDEASGATPG